MPNLDGTGPRGLGPMTGRGLGFCGRGLRRGRRLSRWGWTRPVSRQDEKGLLEQEKELVEKELEEINKRLKDLDK